ncbi:MAG: chemotaxis protein CheA [Actinomycetota bacterium]|nr:chemotaxis protein CheA [Actinomycetota bacterium]
MDISQYKELFINEAQEHLEALNQSMVDLEKDPGNPDVLTDIFRSAHTLKGMSATMGFDQLTELAHEMENVLDGLRSGDIEARTTIVDLLFSCFDMLGSMVAEIAEESSKPIDTKPLIQALREVYEGEKGAVLTTEAPAEEEAEPGGLEEEPVEEEVAVELAEETSADEREGEKTLRLKVTLDEDCVLKSVRVFMIFKKLSQMGKVVTSNPSADDLEDEEFERSFEVIFKTEEALEKVRKSLLTIAEVQEVERLPLEEVEITLLKASEEEEEIEAAVIEGAEPGQPQQEADGSTMAPIRTQSVRVNITRLDNLMNLIGELVINRTRLQEVASSYDITELKEALSHTARLTADLQDEVMKTRMVPVEHIFNRFPRMVRDLAKSRGKEVDFTMEGKEIELDRTILDEISDPLMHLLRNAVDHGIDSPELREAMGKPRRGSIRLSARRDRNYVSMEVSDDGQGVDADKIFNLAVKKGLIAREDMVSMGEEDTLRFLAMPGFSSAEEVSGVSGRGVGLDVVKAKVESLGGMLLMQSKLGEGTMFAMKLPLTLAIIQALLVKVQGEIYAIPLGVVAETAVISQHEIKYVSNQEVIFLRNETIPLLRLSRILEAHEENGSGSFPVVVVEVMVKSVAIAVDELMGQQEIVITSLDRFLKGIRGFGGATILGTGDVALILDIPTLIS